MKLYVDRGGTAPSPRRVRMYLAEKGLRVPQEALELHRDNRTAEFRRRNPLATLPVLELDDGTCIAESLAICRYFELAHPEPPLFGRGPRGVAEVEMWTRRVELYLYLPIDLAPHFARLEDATGAAVELTAWAGRTARMLDRTLEANRFVAGADLTIADIFAYGALDFGQRFAGFRLEDGLPHLRRWYGAMGARQSARA
jgi:glutathione S-transferase